MADKRTNVVLDEQLVRRAQKLTGITTKKGVLHEGLRLLVRLGEQKKLLALRGKVDWEGDLGAMREGRGVDADS